MSLLRHTIEIRHAVYPDNKVQRKQLDWDGVSGELAIADYSTTQAVGSYTNSTGVDIWITQLMIHYNHSTQSLGGNHLLSTSTSAGDNIIIGAADASKVLVDEYVEIEKNIQILEKHVSVSDKDGTTYNHLYIFSFPKPIKVIDTYNFYVAIKKDLTGSSYADFDANIEFYQFNYS